jgi:tRNA dimethylallyltransferase
MIEFDSHDAYAQPSPISLTNQSDRPLATMQFPQDILQRCWFLAGPTACGKSATGLILADCIGAEIVSLDSMAIFRGMDVGTAKPSASERQRIPHHLIDIASPADEFSVADYVEAAMTVCHEIIGRNRVPLFVGGTGLYLRAILRGVFNGPSANWTLRKQLEEQSAANSEQWLWDRLQEIDPEAAERLHANDKRRLIRAIEVVQATGQPLSKLQQQAPLPQSQQPDHVFWLKPERDWLYDRINARVIKMIEHGLVDEVQRLLKADSPISRTARQGLGYKEIISHLEGRLSLSQAIEMIQTRTRQFAKRQHTWFRNLEECRSVDIGRQESERAIADRILLMTNA